MSRPSPILILSLALLLLGAAAYIRLPSLEFVNYDDNLYVTENRQVQQGITPAGIAWAFTTGHSANWHPVTWLSHMVDWQLYGADPAGHHVTNGLLHLLNTLLLFHLLRRMTGAPLRSAFVAALFALHPAHVESVAWVAERKDLLCACFWLLAALAWLGWTRRPTPGRYLSAAALFALALMAKPMAVTLPFVLLLFDWWPLGRHREQGLGRLVLEKLPLFALTLASCLVTYLVQQKGGAVQGADQFPLGERLANAALAYTGYLKNFLLPFGLAVYYPYPESIPVMRTILAVVLLAALTAGTLALRRRRGAVTMGWLFFLGTLVPVIGIVQVGGQAMADRYTYLPYIGLFAALAWGMPALAGKGRAARVGLGAAAAAVLCTLLVQTALQTGHWRNSVTLFRHALAVTERNNLAHNSLGAALKEEGKKEEAIAHFREALAIEPNYPRALANLGNTLYDLNRLEEAEHYMRRTLDLEPDQVQVNANLGALLGRTNRLDQALEHLDRALAQDPDNPEAHNNKGIILAMRKDFRHALTHFEKAVAARPGHANSLFNLARVQARLGMKEKAAATLQHLLQLHPRYRQARQLLKRL